MVLQFLLRFTPATGLVLALLEQRNNNRKQLKMIFNEWGVANSWWVQLVPGSWLEKVEAMH